MAEIFQELLVFLWAVVNNWAGYSTGGVIVAFLALWQVLQNRPVPWGITRKVTLCAAVFFLLCAFFTAWREEYKRSHPGLALVIDQWACVGNDAGYSAAFVVASVSNLGSPSVADSWTLEITPPGESARTLTFQWVQHDQPLVFRHENGQIMTYSSSDMLYVKTASTPVPTGGKVRGMLLFPLKDISLEKAKSVGSRFRLCAHDVAGNPICAERIMEGKGSPGAVYFPGVEPIGPSSDQKTK